MTKITASVTLILLLATLGCGFAIHYGGEAFQRAIKGHMVLGVLALISAVILVISIFKL